MTKTVNRIERRQDAFLVPQPVAQTPGVFQVDATWGTIQPMQIAEGVQTVGELEVIEHLQRGLPVVDARTSDFFVVSTLAGAVNIPYPDTVARMDELNGEQATIFFCNGPQCGQSPTAIHELIDAGYPPQKVLYYRGGLHDWLTLGLPVVPGVDASA